MKRTWFEKIAPAIGFLVALGLLGGSFAISHKVYSVEDEEFGFVSFSRINEADLVEDATFTGIIRKGGKLYTTYDRSKPRGKLACPT